LSTKAKILSTLLFMALVLCLALLTFFGNKEKPKVTIASVSIQGYYLLPEAEYLKFARLDNPASLAAIDLPILKDRIEKHPYIKKAEIELSDEKNVKVYIEERKIKAMLQKNDEAYLITDKYEILPVFAYANISEMPLIINSKDMKNLKVRDKYYSDDIREAFKIMDGFKYIDNDLFKSLTQIDLNNGSDILLNFNCFNSSVIFGKGEDARKIVYLESLYKNYNNQLADSLNYIDLRYSKLIFMGKSNG